MADRIPLLPSDPLFIQDDLGYSPEVLSDMQAADVTFDPSLYPPLPPEEPDMIAFAKDRLMDVGQGFADIPGFVANYFVQPDEQGQPSFISPQEFGEDVKNVGMAMGQAIAEDPVGFALDITPGISNVRAGMEANRLYQQANEQEAQGDALGAAKTRSMASLTTTDMLNPLPTGLMIKSIIAGPMAVDPLNKLIDIRLDTAEKGFNTGIQNKKMRDDYIRKRQEENLDEPFSPYARTEPTLAEQQLYEETGAFVDGVGRRRFEIDTSEIPIPDKGRLIDLFGNPITRTLRPLKSTTLSEVLRLPELYENYPLLKNMEVMPDLLPDQTIAVYRIPAREGVSPKIAINDTFLRRHIGEAGSLMPPFDKELISALLHETQHAVQHFEGMLNPPPASVLANPLFYRDKVYPRLDYEIESRNIEDRFMQPEKKMYLPEATAEYTLEDMIDMPRMYRSAENKDMADALRLTRKQAILTAIETTKARRDLGQITNQEASTILRDFRKQLDEIDQALATPIELESRRPPIQYDLPFDAQNRPRTTDPVPRNPIDQSRVDPYENPADTRDRQRRRKKRGYAEGGIVSLANGGAVEHGVVTL